MTDTRSKRGSKKQIIFLGILFLLLVLFVAGYAAKHGQTVKKIIEVGDLAPDFRLRATDGRIVSLSDFKGKIVMVHFWATWCPPCVDELPLLAKLYPELAGNDFEMLAVSVDDGGADAVTTFMNQHNLHLPVLLNPDRSVAGLYGTFKFPETYIIDRRGVVQYKVIGPINWLEAENVQLLKGMIAQK